MLTIIKPTIPETPTTPEVPGSATVNGRPVTFDAPPKARSGQTWVEIAPLRRAEGCSVAWSPLSNRVVIVDRHIVPPLEGDLVVTSPYGPRVYHDRLFHSGVDLKAAMETPVYSVADGRVTWVGYDPRGFGRYVLVDSGEFTCIYAHLSSPTAARTLLAGERVGFSGGVGPGRGDSDGPHLHWGVYVGPMVLPSGKFDPAVTCDPIQFLGRS